MLSGYVSIDSNCLVFFILVNDKRQFSVQNIGREASCLLIVIFQSVNNGDKNYDPIISWVIFY